MLPVSCCANAKVQLEASRRATAALGDVRGIAVIGCSHPGGSTSRALRATCPERDGSDVEGAGGADQPIGERRSARCLLRSIVPYFLSLVFQFSSNVFFSL